MKEKVKGMWSYKVQETCEFISKIDIFDSPEITACLQIFEDLSVKSYYKNQQLSDSILFVLGKERKLERWTKYGL